MYRFDLNLKDYRVNKIKGEVKRTEGTSKDSSLLPKRTLMTENRVTTDKHTYIKRCTSLTQFQEYYDWMDPPKGVCFLPGVG